MKDKCIKLIDSIFGWGTLITLFGGGLSLVGFIVAFILGGDAAAAICAFINKTYFPILIYAVSIFTMLGLIGMYLKGEKSLTSK